VHDTWWPAIGLRNGWCSVDPIAAGRSEIGAIRPKFSVSCQLITLFSLRCAGTCARPLET